MLFLQISPYSKPIALTEILIILSGAALLGYILARLIKSSRLRTLREKIDQRKIELAECRSLPEPELFRSIETRPIISKGAQKTVYPIQEVNSGIQQDLKIIEGIGPKIEEILNKNGINNYTNLAAMPPVRIAAILKNAGPRYQLHDPTTWPEQAALVTEGKLEELKELQIKLISGRKIN